MRQINVRIDGLRLRGPNATRFTSRAGAMAHARTIQSVREAVMLRVAVATAGMTGVSAVHIERIGPRRLDEDNLVASAKAVIDGVARALRINDRDLVIFGDRPGPRLTYGQRSEGADVYAVIVGIVFGATKVA